MDASVALPRHPRHPRRPRDPRRARHLPPRPTPIFALVAILTLVLAACTAATPTPLPSGTQSTGPAVSATPTPAPTPSPTDAPAFPVTLTDDEGTSVTIEAEPQVIVSLTPAVTETLFALGAGERIAGKSEDVFLFPPEAAAIPDVARPNGVDIERIVLFEPDLVIAGGNDFTAPASVAQLRDLGIPVIVVYAETIDAVFADIELLGTAVGRAAEAIAMVDRIRAEFADVATAVAALPRPKVFYELDATGAIYGPADDSFLAEMIVAAGAVPITTGSPNKYDIAVETLITADPDVILLADAAFGMTAEQVVARPGWDVMTAVKNGDVRPIDDQTVTRPGPRLFLGLQLLARTIHPDAAIPATDPIPPIP